MLDKRILLHKISGDPMVLLRILGLTAHKPHGLPVGEHQGPFLASGGPSPGFECHPVSGTTVGAGLQPPHRDSIQPAVGAAR